RPPHPAHQRNSPMTLTKRTHAVRAIHYTLKTDAGQALDSSAGGQPFMYLLGTHRLIQGLQNELADRGNGAKVNAVIPPELAYRETVAALSHTIDRSMFRGVDNIEPGMVFTAQGENGQQQITVKAVDGDQIIIDGNHEMAGQTLHFD